MVRLNDIIEVLKQQCPPIHGNHQVHFINWEVLDQINIKTAVTAVELNKEQMKALAEKSLTTRFTKDQLKVANINLDELINPVRNEDKGNDLWSVFNVIQEKIITGDFSYLSGAKSRKAREVKNFKQDMDINKKLFAFASELVPEEIAS